MDREEETVEDYSDYEDDVSEDAEVLDVSDYAEVIRINELLRDVGNINMRLKP